MPLDFAISNSLNSGVKDWSQVRADRQMNLTLQAQMNADLEARITQESQARAGVVEYMNQIKQASVLSQDYDRIKGVVDEQVKVIAKGIQKAGNDYTKYLLGNGAGELQNFYNTIMQGEEMQKAQKNKYTMAQKSLDSYLGRVQRPIYDKDGNRISDEQQMSQFKNGEIDELQYNGSVKPVDMMQLRSYVQQTYGKNRYQKEGLTGEGLKSLLKEQGVEDWMIDDAVQGYEYGLQQGANPIYYKSDVAPQSTGGISDKTWKRMLEAMSGDSNMLRSYMNGTMFKELGGQSTNTTWGKTPVVLSGQPMNGEMRDKIMNMTQFRWDDTNKVFYYVGKGAKEEKSGKDLNLAEIDIKPEQIIDYVVAKDNENNMKGYVRVALDMGGRESRKSGLTDSWKFDSDKLEKETTFDVQNDFMGFSMGGDVEGSVLIPVDYNIFSDAEQTYPATKEAKFGENQMQEMMLLYQANRELQEAGLGGE